MTDAVQLRRAIKSADELRGAAKLADLDVRRMTTHQFYRFYLELGESEVRLTFDFTDHRSTIPVPFNHVDELCDVLKKLAALGAAMKEAT